MLGKALSQFFHHFFAVLGAVSTTAFIGLNVVADQPVAQRQTRVHGAGGLRRQFIVDMAYC